MTIARIELPCSCGKRECPNLISVDLNEGHVWISHHDLGGELLIYTTKDRARTFANKLVRALKGHPYGNPRATRLHKTSERKA
jgi:hypothetical protein